MEGFHVDAFWVVMNVVHGRTKCNTDVPREVSLERLGKIAVLVDDLQCQETIEILSEMWIEKLKGRIPTTYNRDLIIWIFVSYVFTQAEIFERVTRTAILESDGEIATLGLPIREKITATISGEREDRIGQASAMLLALFGRLRTASHDTTASTSTSSWGDLDNSGLTGFCDAEACRAMLVGSLIRAMPSLSDGGPLLSGFDTRLIDIPDTLREIKTPRWYSESYGFDDYYDDTGRTVRYCNIGDVITPSINAIISGVEGLDLDKLFPEK